MVPLFALAFALDDILIVFRAQQIQISMAISSSFPLSPSLVVFCKDNATPVHGTTDYGHPMKPFFIEIQNFWAWADKLGR